MISAFVHDLRANAWRLSRGKTGTHFSGSCSGEDGSPPRPKAKSEKERRRRGIRIRPIIGRPPVIIGPVVRAIGITMVMSVATACAKVGRFRRVGCVYAGSRRSRASRINRRRTCQRQGSRNRGRSDPSLHGKAPMLSKAPTNPQRPHGFHATCGSQKQARLRACLNSLTRRSVAADITSGASGDDDDAGDGPSGANALRWSPVWIRPELLPRRRDYSATMPAHARRVRPGQAIRQQRRRSEVSSRS
jgi:hypothetical protein